MTSIPMPGPPEEPPIGIQLIVDSEGRFQVRDSSGDWRVLTIPNPLTKEEERTLRDAAMQMREQHPIGHPRHEMWFLMALHLEGMAVHHYCADVGLKIARSYLAAVGRPDIDGALTQ